MAGHQAYWGKAVRVAVAVVMLEEGIQAGHRTLYVAELVRYGAVTARVLGVGEVVVATRELTEAVLVGVLAVHPVLAEIQQQGLGMEEVVKEAPAYLVIRHKHKIARLGLLIPAAAVAVVVVVLGMVLAVEIQVVMGTPVPQAQGLIQVTRATLVTMLPHQHKIVYQ